jgi:hypothetical protein
VHVPADVLFGHGQWHHARILARWLDRYGRQVVQLEWHAALETWTDEFLADPANIREV